jgi:hypothetical protein
MVEWLNFVDESTMQFRITSFSDFVHRPVFYKLENTTFRKLDLFPSSGEGEETYSVGSLRKRTTPETRLIRREITGRSATKL